MGTQRKGGWQGLINRKKFPGALQFEEGDNIGGHPIGTWDLIPHVGTIQDLVKREH